MKSTGDLRVDQIMPPLSRKWLVLPFEDSIEKDNLSIKKLKITEINKEGKLPASRNTLSVFH